MKLHEQIQESIVLNFETRTNISTDLNQQLPKNLLEKATHVNNLSGSTSRRAGAEVESNSELEHHRRRVARSWEQEGTLERGLRTIHVLLDITR